MAQSVSEADTSSIRGTGGDLIIMGPPGVGKGTQAKALAQENGWVQLSTGEVFRDHIRRGTDLGRRVKGYLERGEYVPDDVTVRMVRAKLEDVSPSTRVLFDGFPRTVAQAEALENMLERRNVVLDAAVSLAVPRKVLVKRLSGRRTCRKCGAMYHVTFNPPATDGACDRCGGELYQREDDREETIEARMEVYDRQSAPLLEYFRTQGLLREVDGAKGTDRVFEQILRKVAKAA